MSYLPKQERDSGHNPLFTTLKNLLILGQWEAANQETITLMLQLANRSEDGWLWPEDFSRLPRPALKILNQLWVQHSCGRFGFSVQQRFWQKVGGLQADDPYLAECRLGDAVGWRHLDGTWLTYSQIQFAANAPRGHLPLAFAWWVEDGGIILGGLGKFWQMVVEGDLATPGPEANVIELPR
ncbi:MAG: GUN4 domain-containing protein [Synechococcales cyanobacterium C42_A2020_086]|jgi:hypothetical protein|nr:GUN4 domain-containing protein [Synechococcales cyanobacterium C42_A2020_086]